MNAVEQFVPEAFRAEDERERRNAGVHLLSMTATKLADGLLDPKLVLAWLFSQLGAPAYLLGALVPVREAGSLLPQLALASRVTAAPYRKHFWAFGSLVQGLSALGIGVAALTLEGAAFGWTALACLAVLALARALCSLSYKDALARSIPKTRRGGVTGAAGSAAGVVVILAALAISTGLIPRSAQGIGLMVCAAGALWILGAALFLRLDEHGGRGEPDTGGEMVGLFAPLRDDPQLRRFIAARALLTVTALAPPFIVALSAAEEAGGLGQLGPLMLASALASILSAVVWGRFSDRSSRQTMMAGACLGALVFAGCATVGHLTGGLGGVAGAALAIFVAQIAYEGVRAGRKLHLTDMAEDDMRARYTALSNTLIGIALMAGGGFGILAGWLGLPAVLLAFALFSLAGIAVAWGLDEVQHAS